MPPSIASPERGNTVELVASLLIMRGVSEVRLFPSVESLLRQATTLSVEIEKMGTSEQKANMRIEVSHE